MRILGRPETPSSSSSDDDLFNHLDPLDHPDENDDDVHSEDEGEEIEIGDDEKLEREEEERRGRMLLSTQSKYLRGWRGLANSLNASPEALLPVELWQLDPADELAVLRRGHREAALAMLLASRGTGEELASYRLRWLEDGLRFLRTHEQVQYACSFEPTAADKRRRRVLCIVLPLLFALLLTGFQALLAWLAPAQRLYWREQSWVGLCAQGLFWGASVFVLGVAWADKPLECGGAVVVTNLRVVRVRELGVFLLDRKSVV